MKDKILESEIRTHAEAIASALRKYSDAPMYASVAIFSRDNTIEVEPVDYCNITVHLFSEDEEIVSLFSKALLLHYGEDGISKVSPFPCEVNEDDSPD